MVRRRPAGPLYLRHFGLREAPFSLPANPDFRLELPGQLEAENVVRVALESGSSIVEVVGEVGTGKTLLARALVRELRAQRAVVYLAEPGESPDALRALLAEALGQPPARGLLGHELARHLRGALARRRRGDRPVVAFVDEAQSAELETLEVLRRLTNASDARGPLLQLVLLGQPELAAKLALPALRQLRQRIAYGCNLGPMSRPTLERYVERRLARAGYQGAPPFTRPALAALHRASGGVPRLVNVLCDKALLSAYGRGDSRVRWRHVRRAAGDSASALSGGAGGSRWVS